jgi:hypothetical protein
MSGKISKTPGLKATLLCGIFGTTEVVPFKTMCFPPPVKHVLFKRSHKSEIP